MISKTEFIRRICKESYEIGKNDGWEIEINRLIEAWVKQFEQLEAVEELKNVYPELFIL